MSLNYGVLLSGGGTNFQAIADHIAQGVLPGKIVLVISNKESTRGEAPGRVASSVVAAAALAAAPSLSLDRKSGV